MTAQSQEAFNMRSLYRFAARSDHPLARVARKLYHAVGTISLPAPRWLVWPALQVFLVLRAAWHGFLRIVICEPLFKAYCTRYGRGLHTGVFIHWVQGRGDLILGEDVLIDGKCSFTFASRFTARPTLEIGDHSGIGHACTFTVGKRITIGRHCRIASGVWMFDSSGHPTDPAARCAGQTIAADEVRPITIADNVWIGARAILFPGVAIGENSVVSAGAVVMSDVPANTIVAGNPARKIAVITTKTEA